MCVGREWERKRMEEVEEVENKKRKKKHEREREGNKPKIVLTGKPPSWKKREGSKTERE